MTMTCKKIAASAVILMTLISCDVILPDKTEPTPTEIFDELWDGVNQRYVCFSNKDLDWDAVYTKYRGQINDETDENRLFKVLRRMLEELKDGHVDLESATKTGFGYQRDSILNKSPYIVDLYLGKTRKKSDDFRYNIIHDGKVGYLEYTSFQRELSDDEVYDALVYCKDCQGLILDLRDNPGGLLKNMMTLLKYLPSEEELFKSYVRHNDVRNDLIQKAVTFKANINDKSKIWRKPLIVLIDNRSYSAASMFAMCVKGCENVRVVGVKTAGGTAIPEKYELSNGWIYRIPTTKLISRSGIDYEDGVPPDVEVHFDMDRGRYYKDSIIETACEIIESQSDKRN